METFLWWHTAKMQVGGWTKVAACSVHLRQIFDEIHPE